MAWKKIGNILKPDKNIHWMATHAGPSFAIQSENDTDTFYILVSGRDIYNRSRLGLVIFHLTNLNVCKIFREPVLELGERGTFDENGTSYPCMIKHNKKWYMYYTGWIPAVMVPFMVDLGLAVGDDFKKFNRLSKAPLFAKTNEEYLSIGSVFVMKDQEVWRMWYTCFKRWCKDENGLKHYYNIKYAESKDGINWQRKNKVCIDFKSDEEYAISRPSVLKINSSYHMWYSYRGEKYKIGYAVSDDAIHWIRLDNKLSLDISPEGWDSEMVCYPFVFKQKNRLYMLYNGNGYGKTGLGLAVLDEIELLRNI